MVFAKNSSKTRAAGRKGGLSGDKHLSTMPKGKLKEFSKAAGQKSGEARRYKKALERRAANKEKKIMEDYLIDGTPEKR